MSKYLVTGGAGFIGSHIVDALIDKGYEVVIVDNLSGGFVENVNKKATFIKEDITDDEAIDAIFAEYKPDYVIHAAAYAAEGLSHHIRRHNYEVNLSGSINLINSSIKHGVRHFTFLSSIAVLGVNNSPIDPYGIAKQAVELDLNAANAYYNLQYSVIRLHNVYGERQNLKDKYRNVIGIFMNAILVDQDVSIFGDGEQTRAFTYIKDIIPTIIAASFNNRYRNTVTLVGSESNFTINKVAELMNIPISKIKHVEERKEVRHTNTFGSHKRERLIDETPLWKGLSNMKEWAKNQNYMKPLPAPEIEIIDNLPPSWK